jgi:hypothetical protein
VVQPAPASQKYLREAGGEENVVKINIASTTNSVALRRLSAAISDS